MTSKRDLEKRLKELRGVEDIEDLPLATITETIAADEVEIDGPPGVLFLDGEPHKVGDISAADLNF